MLLLFTAPDLLEATIMALLPPANACVAAAVCRRWREAARLPVIRAKYFLPEKTARRIARKLISYDSDFHWSIRAVPATPLSFAKFQIYDTRRPNYAWRTVFHSKRQGMVYF